MEEGSGFCCDFDFFDAWGCKSVAVEVTFKSVMQVGRASKPEYLEKDLDRERDREGEYDLEREREREGEIERLLLRDPERERERFLKKVERQQRQCDPGVT